MVPGRKGDRLLLVAERKPGYLGDAGRRRGGATDNLDHRIRLPTGMVAGRQRDRVGDRRAAGDLEGGAQGGTPQKMASFGTFPVWSHDGQTIFYSGSVNVLTAPDERLWPRIWRVSANGGEPQAITTSPEQSTRPWVSRDGRMLLYRAVRSNWPELLKR
jgi:WD40-like Beta Propeller Repeat